MDKYIYIYIHVYAYTVDSRKVGIWGLGRFMMVVLLLQAWGVAGQSYSRFLASTVPGFQKYVKQWSFWALFRCYGPVSYVLLGSRYKAV